MSAQGEPEKYSIDEMMERLKNPSNGDLEQNGELVTRADGSQAVRVRKRKRRSHQPHKDERRQSLRTRMVQVSAALILLLLAVFAAAAAIIYANSAPFRESLIEKISRSSGATASLEQFRMNPSTANASTLTLAWPEGNVMQTLALHSIKTEIFPSSFLGKSMTGEETSAAEGQLTLRIPQTDKPSRVSPATDEEPPIRFVHYAVPKFAVLIGDPSAPVASLLKSDASFQPVNPNGRAQLLLNHGEVYVMGWPNLRMDRSHIEFRGGDIDIIGMRLQHESDSRGVFELSGTVSPYAPDRASTLSIRLESYLLSGIAGPQLGKLFSGRIDTLSSAKSNYLSFVPGPSPECSLAVSFHSSIASPMEISGFPFLVGLARSLDDSWFEHPVFEDESSGILRRNSGNVSLADLSLENKSRMALRGLVTLSQNQKLSGNLEVGVTEAMIKSSKNRRLDSIFGPPKDGFRWITLKIGGSGGGPTDDFKELYEAANSQPPPPSKAEAPSFEDLTRPK